jgi:LysM repeat protein
MIGIRIASGEFFPVAGEAGSQTKRLVLTTVKDDQTSVHIDLYRSAEIDFKDARYLGSLVIDGLPERPKQIPDIELIVKVSDDGSLHAVATDRESGRSKSLDAGISGGEEGPENYGVPDFELDPRGPFAAEETESEPVRPLYEPSLTVMREEEPIVPAKRGLPTGALIAIIAGGILILALIAFLAAWLITGRVPFFSGGAVPVVAASPAPSPEPSQAPSPVAAAEKNGSKGVNHKIRWGDTLWHISIRYYGTPWLYPKIAKANKIKNPDRIISGRTLWIPPR